MTALGAAASTTHAMGVVSSLATGISGCLGMVFFALGPPRMPGGDAHPVDLQWPRLRQ